MSKLAITCACGMRGTYHSVWVAGGFRIFSEDSIIIWHDPTVEKVADLKLSIQKNIERPVYRCLSCAFKKQDQDEAKENERKAERIKLKAEKAEARAAHPSLFTRLFGGKEK